VELIAVGIELPLPPCARDTPASRARLLVAANSKLNILLGDKRLTDRVMNVL
jgi:hypothetical protein